VVTQQNIMRFSPIARNCCMYVSLIGTHADLLMSQLMSDCSPMGCCGMLQAT
jgi:hypothetical protein